jgi:hypothetical protein
MTKLKLILGVMVLLVCFCFSVFLSPYTYNSDFPVFYYAANTILDPNVPNTSVYDIDTNNRYSMPEAMGKNHVFLFSMPGAYIMAPLALMSYFRAKSVMIFINILMYLAATLIALRIGGASGRWFAYPLALLCLWPPFVQNLRHGQINAILLFLIAVAVLAATKNSPVLSGVFLAIATLFKLFPIAIAMVLGIKNWRIFVSCVVVFGVSFLIPGSLKWFHAISNIYPAYNPIYQWLKQFNPSLFFIFAAAIAGITALIIYKVKGTNYPLITSLAIPAVFLTMPIIEYYHLTLLTFSYAYLIASLKRFNRLILTSYFLSIILISIPFFHIKSVSSKSFVLLGLFVFWGALAYNLSGFSFMRDQNV